MKVLHHLVHMIDDGKIRIGISTSLQITFLDVLPKEMTCAGGMDPVDVANNVQKLLAGSLGFECTHLTRKEKYMDLCGSDGSVSMSSSSSLSHRS